VASFLYDNFRLLMGGTGTPIDLNDGTLAMGFIDEADDTPDQTNDVNCAAREAAGAFVPAYASCPNLTNNAWTVTSNVGMLDDDTDLVFSSLSGDQSESIDLFLDTATDSTSLFISNHDDYTGLPLTPSGGNVTIVFAATGIIRI